MANLSINALLSMEKSLKQRVHQLNELKNQSTSRTRYYGMEQEEKRVEEPTYDVKDVDRKIVELNKALFNIDQTIKESNAKVKVDIDIDYDSLVSPLE